MVAIFEEFFDREEGPLQIEGLDGNPFFPNQSEILRYPVNEDGKVHARILFTEVESFDRTKKDKDGNTVYDGFQLDERLGRTVSLYIPEGGIQVADKAAYENAELGTLGQAILNADINQLNIRNAIDNLANSTSQMIQFAQGGVQDMGVITKVLQQTPFLSERVRQSVQARIGRTANPYLRTIFKQVDQRSFSFQFEMVPTSADEARVIEEIVLFFRSRLYPSVDDSESSANSSLATFGVNEFVYKFPSKFKLQYKFRNSDGTFGHKFLPCYLEGVTTNMNNNNTMSYHPDGKFLSTTLSLEFKEETALTREDINRGF